MTDTKYPPLLKNTPYVGSASNRVVHRTEANCPQALEISPNERWYIKDIPYDGNYLMCPFCFPQAQPAVAETVPVVEPGQDKPKRKRAVKGKTAAAGEVSPADAEAGTPVTAPAPEKTATKKAAAKKTAVKKSAAKKPAAGAKKAGAPAKKAAPAAKKKTAPARSRKSAGK